MELGLEMLNVFDDNAFRGIADLASNVHAGAAFGGMKFDEFRGALSMYRETLYRAAHGELPPLVTRAQTQMMNLFVCELLTWLKHMYPDVFREMAPEKRLSPAQFALYRRVRASKRLMH